MAFTLLSGLGKFCMIDALFNNPDYVAGTKELDAIVLRQEAIGSNTAKIARDTAGREAGHCRPGSWLPSSRPIPSPFNPNPTSDP